MILRKRGKNFKNKQQSPNLLVTGSCNAKHQRINHKEKRTMLPRPEKEDKYILQIQGLLCIYLSEGQKVWGKSGSVWVKIVVENSQVPYSCGRSSGEYCSDDLPRHVHEHPVHCRQHQQQPQQQKHKDKTQITQTQHPTHKLKKDNLSTEDGPSQPFCVFYVFRPHS